MKGFRTILFNVVGIGTALLTQPELGALIPPKAAPYILGGVCVGNIVLRTITNTPIGQSQPLFPTNTTNQKSSGN